MRLENITVGRDTIGWHGIGSAEVLSTDPNEQTATIDIGNWVDADGIGESVGGHPVEKEFTSIIVLLDDVEMDTDTYARHAARAYVGTDGDHEGDRYWATFDDLPPTDTYRAFFPHTTEKIDGTITATDCPVDDVVTALTSGK